MTCDVVQFCDQIHQCTDHRGRFCFEERSGLRWMVTKAGYLQVIKPTGPDEVEIENYLPVEWGEMEVCRYCAGTGEVTNPLEGGRACDESGFVEKGSQREMDPVLGAAVRAAIDNALNDLEGER